MILLKLGGSIITDKDRPITVRRKVVDNLGKTISKISEPVIIIHGGGSFGHYWSVKYNMHTKPSTTKSIGVARVRESMISLNDTITKSFIKSKLPIYSIPPSVFMIGNKPIVSKIKEILQYTPKMIPMTYGDALLYDKNRYYILSGDVIMSIFAKILKPRLVIFTTNVDGLYSDLKTKKIFSVVKNDTKGIITDNPKDVTGGMVRKVAEAKKISKMKYDTFFINGNKPQRILDVINGKKFVGTKFEGKK